MSNYQKGARFERDLVSAFWGCGWAAVRAAGSGSVGFPVPDVLAVRDGRTIAVECKSSRKDKAYLKDAVLQLREFAEVSGAEAYLAVKFLKKKPMFFDVKEEKYVFSVGDPCMSLEQVVGEQGRL